MTADPTVAEFAPIWLRQKARRIDSSSVAKYELYFRRHILPFTALSERPMPTVRRPDVVALAEHLEDKDDGLAPGSIRGILKVLHGMFAAARRDGVVLTNPVDEIVSEYRGEEGEPFTRGDLLAFLATVRQHETPSLRRLFPFMLKTGVRIAESLALDRYDIDTQARVVSIAKQRKRGRIVPYTKTGKARLVDLTDDALELVREQIAENGDCRWIWMSSVRQAPWSVRHVQYIFEGLVRQAGLTKGIYTPHSLRHTYATLLVEAGVDLRYIKEQLGHSTIAITSDLYARRARSPRPAALGVLDVLIEHQCAPTELGPDARD